MLISFLVKSVGVWKASVFDHDEVHQTLWYIILAITSEYPSQYIPHTRGWVETSKV